CVHTTSSFLSFLTPLPPSSTLFPYTTLFRSLLAAIENGAQIVNISLGAYADSPMLADAIERALAAGIAVVAAAGNDQAARLAWPDRNSTRLDSSHVKISYAVFCLKKKNK